MVRLAALALLLAACRDDGPTDLGLGGGALADGRVGFDYSAALAADEAGPSATWRLSDGELPPGIELSGNGQAGALTGIPEHSGDFGFTVEVEDGELFGAADFSLHVPRVCLMSGYEPFGGYPTNPSIEALLPLHEELVADLDVRVVELPVVWDEAWDVLVEDIALLDPDIVISTGQSGTDAMRFETVAQNVEYGADNDGVERNGEPVVEGGPETLADTLPEAEMAAAIEAAGLATTISSNAGTYLCNFVFYRLMYYAEMEAERDMNAGFIHVSPASEGYAYTVGDITAAHRAGLAALSAWLQTGAPLSPAPPADTAAAPLYFGGSRP